MKAETRTTAYGLLAAVILLWGINWPIMKVGLQYVDAGRSAILAYTTPLWVTPLAVFWLKEKLSAAKWADLALGLGGVAAVSFSDLRRK